MNTAAQAHAAGVELLSRPKAQTALVGRLVWTAFPEQEILHEPA